MSVKARRSVSGAAPPSALWEVETPFINVINNMYTYL